MKAVARFPILQASVWCASWRLRAGNASTHANVPALTAIIKSNPQAKSAYGRGQDKRADAERGADLPDELMVKRNWGLVLEKVIGKKAAALRQSTSGELTRRTSGNVIKN